MSFNNSFLYITINIRIINFLIMWFTFYHVELVPSFCHDFLAKRRLGFSHQQTVNVEQEILDAREEGARAWALLPYSIVLTKWSHIWNPRKSVPDIRRVTMDAPEVSTVIWHYMSPVTLRQFHNRINCFDNEFDENQTRIWGATCREWITWDLTPPPPRPLEVIEMLL